MRIQENQVRKYKKIDGLFQFKADWEQVSMKEHWEKGLKGYRYLAVPASWNDQTEELKEFFGTGWYEKEIWIPENWRNKEIWIRLEGVSIGCQVFLDGQRVGNHRGIGLPFEWNISHLVQPGKKHRLDIAVEGKPEPCDLPPARLDDGKENEGVFHFYPAVSYDYFPYAGIHRSIYLYAVHPKRLTGIHIDTHLEHLTDTTAEIDCRLTFSEKMNGKVRLSLLNPEQKIEFIEEEPLYAENDAALKKTFVLGQSCLWDVDSPSLYQLLVELFDDRGQKTDEYIQNFGIRKIEIKEDQLLLNGKKRFLKGFGKHEDFILSGKGFQPVVLVKDYDLLKWIGANSYRTSHYPYDSSYLDYADEQGILVIAETPFVGLNQRMFQKEISERACEIIRQMIERDYNHPSVIMWSLANEPVVSSEEGKEFFRKMAQTAKECDQTRPITYAAHMEPEDNLGMEFFDVVSINKYYGWYEQPGEIEKGTKCLLECMDRFHDTFHKPVLLTEFGADAAVGMHSFPARMFSEEYQSELLKTQYLAARTKKYCIGTHIWAFADFQTPQAITRVMGNKKGVFTRDREPKLAAHTIRELWNPASENDV